MPRYSHNRSRNKIAQKSLLRRETNIRALRFAVLLATISLAGVAMQVNSTTAAETNGNNLPSKGSPKKNVTPSKAIIAIVAACNSDQADHFCKYTVSMAEFIRSQFLSDNSVAFSNPSEPIPIINSGDELGAAVTKSRNNSNVIMIVGPFPKDKNISNLFPINVANLSKAIVESGRVIFPIYAGLSGGGDTTIVPAEFFDAASKAFLRRNIKSVLSAK